MKRRPRLVIAAVLSLLTATATLVSCKQGEGERCQVTSDCADDLVCGSSGGAGATLTCREPTPITMFDAMQFPDAFIPDAGASGDAP